MTQTLQVKWGGQHFDLLNEKAAFWRETNTLLLADPHFGKTSTFRASGIPIPPGSTKANIRRLESVLKVTGCTRLIILGDFFHHANGRCANTMRALEEWRSRWPELEVILVRGNHDKHAGDPPREWDFNVVHEPHIEGAFNFCHKPCSSPNFTFAGHTHPAISLRTQTGACLRLPCFIFGSRSAVLPAFGEFTGTASVYPSKDDHVFVIADGEVVEIPGLSHSM